MAHGEFIHRIPEHTLELSGKREVTNSLSDFLGRNFLGVFIRGKRTRKASTQSAELQIVISTPDKCSGTGSTCLTELSACSAPLAAQRQSQHLRQALSCASGSPDAIPADGRNPAEG